jgi:hypothetical protein
MEALKESIRDFTDDHLLEEYFYHSEDYTHEAYSVLKEEFERRNFDAEKLNSYLDKGKEADPGRRSYDSKDFTRLENSFSHTDALLAITMLRDSGIVFFLDNPNSSEILPLESEAERLFTIHVHNDFIGKAHELLDEHFTKNDGKYILKYTGAIERLKAFNFHDLHINEFKAAELIDVSFTTDERRVITHYGRKLLEEAERIESEQERVLFYYDSIEAIIEKLEKDCKKLSRSDLLAILEILQIYCYDQSFPELMNDSIMGILNLFTGI